MTKDDGGSAFPIFSFNNAAHSVDASGGMSLRDYFASHAPAYPFKLPECSLQDEMDPVTKLSRAIADWNFAYADAMLAERAK